MEVFKEEYFKYVKENVDIVDKLFKDQPDIVKAIILSKAISPYYYWILDIQESAEQEVKKEQQKTQTKESKEKLTPQEEEIMLKYLVDKYGVTIDQNRVLIKTWLARDKFDEIFATLKKLGYKYVKGEGGTGYFIKE